MIRDATWICHHCKQTFDKPKLTHDGGYYEEPFYVCPFCGDDDFSIEERCAECDTVHPQGELHNGFCDECLNKLVKKYAVEFVTEDEDFFKEDFSWWMHKRMRERGVSA